MPPHIAQLILGHDDVNTTMGYKAVYRHHAPNSGDLPAPPANSASSSHWPASPPRVISGSLE